MPHEPRYRFHRPPWWPENQPWPPPPGRFRRRPFRRMGCFFAIFNLLGFALFVLLVAYILRSFGPFDSTFLARWSVPLLVAAAVLIVVIIGLSVTILRRFSAPLDDLHEAAGRIAEGDYSTRVSEIGPAGIRSLARAINNMAARLYQVDKERRSLLADTTHELLTPLTVIQGNLEGMLDGVYPADEANLRSLLDETQVFSRLLEDLRTLALAESGALQLRKEPTDLLPFLKGVIGIFQSQADAAGVKINLEVVENLPAVEVDPGRLRQVLSNLIANALRYSPAGSTMHLTCERDGGNILLVVQDEGPGIPAADLPHIFERFYKSADSGGMGLGLAIAKQLVEAHGGTIQAENATGRGTVMRIRLPITDKNV